MTPIDFSALATTHLMKEEIQGGDRRLDALLALATRGRRLSTGAQRETWIAEGGDLSTLALRTAYRVSSSEIRTLQAEELDPIVLLLEDRTWLLAYGVRIPAYTASIDATLPGEEIAQSFRDDPAPSARRYVAVHMPQGGDVRAANVATGPTEAIARRRAAYRALN
jgi:hypothetical protein